MHVQQPAMANTKDHHLHSVCPCCDVVQHIKAIICCHGILTLSNRNAHTRDANTLKTKTTLLFTVFKFTVLCTTLLSSRAIIPVTLQICVQSTVHECTKKRCITPNKHKVRSLPNEPSSSFKTQTCGGGCQSPNPFIAICKFHKNYKTTGPKVENEITNIVHVQCSLHLLKARVTMDYVGVFSPIYLLLPYNTTFHT